MTPDEKQVLKSIGGFILFKALLYLAINRAAKAAREMADQYDPNFNHTMQFGKKPGTDILGAHAKVNNFTEW